MTKHRYLCGLFDLRYELIASSRDHQINDIIQLHKYHHKSNTALKMNFHKCDNGITLRRLGISSLVDTSPISSFPTELGMASVRTWSVFRCKQNIYHFVIYIIGKRISSWYISSETCIFYGKNGRHNQTFRNSHASDLL